MHIVSINVAQPETRVYFGKEVQTSGHKQAVSEARLHLTNFEGDRQSDLKNHGGPDKAVCVYSFDHYPHWEHVFGAKLPFGAFSENLTIAGLQESEVSLGDVLRIGAEARVQISQPRQPCSKLAGKHNRKDLPDLIHANGWSGFYFRVIQEGVVKAGDPVEVIERHPLGLTVEFANQVMYRQRPDRASLERVLAVEALSDAWRKSLSKRL
jgi:MOSC domain-containing protein YiiM